MQASRSQALFKTVRRTWRSALLAVLFLVVLASAFFFERATRPLVSPNFLSVKQAFTPSDFWLLDRNGEPVEQKRINQQGRRLAWVPLEAVSFALRNEVVGREDRNFFEHQGVDIRALAHSVYQSIRSRVRGSGFLRGGSTISMQVASMVVGTQSGRRSFLEKARQVRQALLLERSWSKSQILEAYLNLVHFRGEIQGVSAASRLLLEKDPHGLSAGDAIVLAAMISSPSGSLRRLAERLCVSHPESCESLRQTTIEIGKRDGRDRVAIHLAPHVARQLAAQNLNQVSLIRSTLDRSLQARALDLATEQLNLLKHQNVHDAAMLVVDNVTGQVLVYVGNVPNMSSAPYIDGVQTKRQAGSTLKPFLFATAFDKQILTPNSLLNDQPWESDTGRGQYRPKNYDKRFRGVVTVRDALGSSMNIPSVKALELLGPDALVETLSALGVQDLNSGDDYGVSLALGTADVTLWELVRAYRSFANGGLYSDLKLEMGGRTPTGSARVFSASTVYRIADILSDREARSATFGLENPLATPFWTAVKTGTSKDMRDNWCIGFSSHYTVGVWVGNFNGESMWDVSGISGAAPIWVGLMNALHERIPSERPLKPTDLIEDDIQINVASNMNFRKILLPSSGSIMTLDPDIPMTKQKILLQASGKPDRNMKWYLNGKLLGRADRGLLWTLKPGRYHLKLQSRNGVEDESYFSVRAGR